MIQLKTILINLLLTWTVLLACLIGDKLVSISRGHWSKAILDNVTHGIVGLVSSLIVLLHFRDRMVTTEFIILLVLSYLLSSGIDLDHFIAARSFHIHDATNLTHRPFLHDSTITVILLICLLYTDLILRPIRISLWLSIAFICFATHHIRDATRRGLWFVPFGSTGPLPYYLYIMLILVLPYLINYIVDVGKQKPILFKPILV